MKKNLISEKDLSVNEAVLIFRTANHFKKLRRRELLTYSRKLRGRRMILIFYEPSTRTRISFELAARSLGIQTYTAISSASSALKGEALADEALTFSSMGFDAAVIRHPQSGSAKTFADSFAGLVINGGDGISAHPSQALLDAFTLWERQLLKPNLKVGIVGDILNSRVARSNARLLNKFGITPMFIAPPEMLPKLLQRNNQIVDMPGDLGYRVHIFYNFDEVIGDLDVVMMLRIQRERYDQLPISVKEFARRYQLNAERLAKLKQGAVIMHPGPVNRGVEIADEVFADRRCLITEQVRNGYFVRMSILNFFLK